MLKIVDNKIWKDGEKIGWIDGHHVRLEDGTKLGYSQDNFAFNEAGHKLAYIHENDLALQNGESSTPLEKINEEVEGEYPILMKSTVWVLLQD